MGTWFIHNEGQKNKEGFEIVILVGKKVLAKHFIEVTSMSLIIIMVCSHICELFISKTKARSKIYTINSNC